jgi:hypothetical protein
MPLRPELEGELRERWEKLRAAKEAKIRSGAGGERVNGTLSIEEQDQAVSDTRGGKTPYERQRREERNVATTEKVNGKHATNGKPLCPKCNKPVRVYKAGGTRCYYCDNPNARGLREGNEKPAKPAPDHPWKDKKTPAAPAGQERRAEADPPNHTAPRVQAEVEATTSAPAAGNTHVEQETAATVARDLGALGRFALPDFVELEPAEEDLDVELRAFRALLGLTLAQRRRVLAFTEAVSAN